MDLPKTTETVSNLFRVGIRGFGQMMKYDYNHDFPKREHTKREDGGG